MESRFQWMQSECARSASEINMFVRHFCVYCFFSIDHKCQEVESKLHFFFVNLICHITETAIYLYQAVFTILS